MQASIPMVDDELKSFAEKCVESKKDNKSLM